MGQNPCRTNDVDTDQRRRTLNSAGAMPLTKPFIEGSHESAFEQRLTTSCPCISWEDRACGIG